MQCFGSLTLRTVDVMFRVARVPGLVAFLFVVSIVGAANSTPGAAAVHSVSVLPSTGLASGSTIAVSGTGYAPDASIGIAQCRFGATSQNDCDLSTVVLTTADSNGEFGASLTVKSVLNVVGMSVNCTASAGACLIGAADIADIANTGRYAPLTFLGSGVPKRGTVIANPTQVAAASIVTVTGAGWAANASLVASQCIAGTTTYVFDPCGDRYDILADSSGAFTAEITVWDEVWNTDCAQSPGACTIFVADVLDEVATFVNTPLTVVPLDAGSIQAAPANNLHRGSSVTISGSGWLPGRDIYLLQCFADCDTDVAELAGGFVRTDGTGAFNIQVIVERWTYGSAICGSAGVACSVEAYDSQGSSVVTAAVPISFVPLAIAKKGSFAAPLASLVGAPVVVSGADWAPETRLVVAMCPTGIRGTACEGRDVAADEAGAVSNAAIDLYSYANGVDCAIVGNCEIVMWDARDALNTLNARPFVFLVPPAGTITVTPSTTLAEGTIVTVAGSGWVPNSYVSIKECVTVQQCTWGGHEYSQGATANSSGDFSTTFVVHDFLPGGQGWPVDCSPQAGTCELVAMNYLNGRILRSATPLGFVSDAQTVTSSYSTHEMNTMQAGASELGLTVAEYQRQSVWISSFLFSISHATPISIGNAGVGGTVATLYPGWEARYLGNVAAQHGLSFGDYQKLSSLLVGYLLALG